MEGFENLTMFKEALSGKRRGYCQVVLLENGEPIVRRMYSMLTQDANGELHLKEGDELPLAFIFNTRKTQRGRHLGQLLLNPRQRAASERPAPTGFGFKSLAVVFVAGVLAAHSAWSIRNAMEREQYQYSSHR